jgi:hypothetical protein
VSPYHTAGLLLLAILLFASIRIRLKDMPLERDEGEYAYAGQLILQGISPYQLAYNMKLPGTYAAYAVILAIFGQTPSGIHTGLLVVNAATTLIIFLITRRLLDALAAVVAASSYGLLSTSPSVLGLAAHAAHFVVLAGTAAVLVLLKAIESRRTGLFFCSGLLAGVAFVMKQPGIVFLVFAGMYLLKSEWKHRFEGRGPAVRAGVFLLGGIVPYLLTCLFVLTAGTFKSFWLWTFLYARQYATSLSISDGMQAFTETFPQIVAPALPIWIIAAAGLTTMFWNSRVRANAVFFGGFIVFSFLGVCPGFYFREHYFILMLPAVAMLTGVAVSSAWQFLSEHRSLCALHVAPVFLFLLACSYALFQQRQFLFELDPVAACREMYGGNPFPEALKIADYLRSHSTKETRVAVLGSEPEIYFYAKRHSATGYIYTYPLMEEQEYALKMQSQMIHEIEEAQPGFIVYVDVPTSWLVRPGTKQEQFFTWAEQYVEKSYELIGTVDILGDHTEYHWDEDAKTYVPRSDLRVQVFRRKA